MKIFSEELTGGWSTCTAEILQLLLIIKSTFSQVHIWHNIIICGESIM